MTHLLEVELHLRFGYEGLGSLYDQRGELREGVALLKLGLGVLDDADLMAYGGILGAGYSDMVLVGIHEFHEVWRQFCGVPEMHLLQGLELGCVDNVGFMFSSCRIVRATHP